MVVLHLFNSHGVVSCMVVLCLMIHGYLCYSGPPLSMEDMFQDLQWIPETRDRLNLIYTMFFSCVYISVIKLSL